MSEGFRTKSIKKKVLSVRYVHNSCLALSDGSLASVM